MPRVDGLSSLDPSSESESTSDSEARRRIRYDWTAEVLDYEEGRIGYPVLDQASIRGLLASKPRIAIVGASPNPMRASHGVLVDLLALGYNVVPVNPGVPEVGGLRCYATLRDAVDATGPVDIVDVFRLPPACPPHAREAVAANAGCLWLQLGIVSREAGRIAHDAGLAVVMNRCLAVEAARAA